MCYMDVVKLILWIFFYNFDMIYIGCDDMVDRIPDNFLIECELTS